MKKFLTLLFSFILTISISHGQEKSKYEVGFQTGLVLGTAIGNSFGLKTDDPIAGFGLGIHALRKINEQFSVKMKINFEQQGWARRNLIFESPNPGPGGSALVEADALYRLSYVNVPILAEYRFGKKLQLYLNGGGFIGFLLEANGKIRFDDPSINDNILQNLNIKNVNVGLASGLGISYPITSKLKINAETNQQFGMIDISNDPLAVTKIKLNAFSFLTGLSFHF